MAEVKTFTKNTTPFLVNFHQALSITKGEGIFNLDNERMKFTAATILLLLSNKWRQ
ncbi:MAG: hypothetical protein AAFY45_27315 [Bacteroidota bacterium]